MLRRNDIRKIAKARLKDAQALFGARRYDGAVYLCGYAVELGLKCRICRSLKWDAFPSTQNEFGNYKTFKTHNLDVLLDLSGEESKIKTDFLAEWSAVAEWDPEVRYNPSGIISRSDAQAMITATTALLRVL